MLVILCQNSMAVRRQQTDGGGDHLSAQTPLPPLFEEELALTIF